MSDPRTLEQLLADCHTTFVVNAPRIVPPPPPPALPVEPKDTAGDQAKIPSSFRWAKLDAPDLRRRVGRERAVEEGRGALDAEGLLLVGPSGSGKTSLACALLRAWLGAGSRRSGVFVPAWKLGGARAQHGLGQGEPPEVDRALSASLVVIDDLGSERNTAINAVPDVIFERAYRGMPTWVTTWMTSEQISQRYGDGIARRLYEAGRVVVIGCGRET